MGSELGDRLDQIENTAASRPGKALDEFEAVLEALPTAIESRTADAQRLVRNEDLAGGARELSEASLDLQRAATLSLTLRDAVRSRR